MSRHTHRNSGHAIVIATPDPVSRVQHHDVSCSSSTVTMSATSDLPGLVETVAAALRKQWDRQLRAQIPALSAPRAAVILQLGCTGGASQTRLARLLGLSQMTVSRLLDGLESRGWIHREPVPADRRAWAVRLTDEGKRVLAGAHAARRAFVDGIGATLDEERRTILVSTLAALETHARTVPRSPL